MKKIIKLDIDNKSLSSTRSIESWIGRKKRSKLWRFVCPVLEVLKETLLYLP